MNQPESEEIWDKLQECLESAAAALAHLTSQQKPKKQEPEATIEQKKQKISQDLLPAVRRMEKGMIKILELLATTGAQEPEFLTEKLTEQLCQIAAIASVLADHPQEYLMLIANEKTLEEVFGLNEQTLETLYQAAKHLYEHQHYAESAAAFSVLSVISPHTHIFWLGLGNSEYFCQNYEAALMAYALAAHSNPHDPLCHFFSAHCYEAMRQKDHAINALELALLAMGDQEQFLPWKQKALEHKQRLTKKE